MEKKEFVNRPRWDFTRPHEKRPVGQSLFSGRAFLGRLSRLLLKFSTGFLSIVGSNPSAATLSSQFNIAKPWKRVGLVMQATKTECQAIVQMFPQQPVTFLDALCNGNPKILSHDAKLTIPFIV